MKNFSYYNDIDPFICEWAKTLVSEGLVPDGEVDRRDIKEIDPKELKRFTQHHFFCGILGWPYALRLAGWPEDIPVCTASLPCQPFSVAGKGLGEKDDRHLWPYFRNIVEELEFDTIFGEQVASPAGRTWLAGVQTDLEALGFAFGAADLCAAGIGAPHIRQRLFWVADTESHRNRTGKNAQGGLSLTSAVLGTTAPTENSGAFRLNPRFSLWLMGYPTKWAYCGERVTR